MSVCARARARVRACVRACVRVCVCADSSEVGRVQAAIAHLESLTCITFREVNATDQVKPILSFKKDAG